MQSDNASSSITQILLYPPSLVLGSLGLVLLFLRHKDEMVDFRAHLTKNGYSSSFFLSIETLPLTVRIEGERPRDHTDTSR